MYLKHLQPELQVSRTHGFFICMGGFVTTTGHHPIVTDAQLDDETVALIRQVEEDDIKDRSKRDALAKALALTQVIWSITQSAARLNQQLPVSQLEVATGAFAVVNLFIWTLWWGKPLDVEQSILISTPELLGDCGTFQSPVKFNFRHRAIGMLWGSYLSGQEREFQPWASTSVPSFWSDDSDPHAFKTAVITECFVAAIFGGVHCLAWSTTFPSDLEELMWKLSALIVTFFPALLLPLFITIEDDFRPELMGITISVLFFFFFSFYIIARVFLIVLPFLALRALRPGTLRDVEWSRYIYSTSLALLRLLT